MSTQWHHQVSPQIATIGDVLTYQCIATVDAGLSLTSPISSSNTLGDFQILHRQTISKTAGGHTVYTFTYQIAAYKTGALAVPTLNTLPALPVTIQSVVTQDLKTAAIKDIADPLHLSINWKPYILSGLGLIVLIVGMVCAYKKWKKKTGQGLFSEPVIDLRTPAQKAREALDALKEKNYLAKGQTKIHYLLMTEIMKQYFSELFHASLADMTTDECLQFLRSKCDEQTLRRIKNLLQSSDLAKFAKYSPTDPENEENWERAFDVIKRTSPLEEVVA